MVFSSLTFLCVFLPVVFLAYLVLPNKHVRNALLIVASLVFYAYGEPVYVLLMLASSTMNWLFGLAIGRRRAAATSSARAAVPRCNDKLLLIIAIVANLAILAIFKYAGMAAETLGLMLSTSSDSLPFAQIVLPIGISFYTFQALSYVIDVYRGEVVAQKSFARVLLFISFFPQLIAGPIIKYHDVEAQLEKRSLTLAGTASGLRRFAVGLGKKVLIANTLGAVADAVYAAPQSEVNIAVAWIGALAYLAQIYFDFSGYSDMAIGLARMFGFRYKENFNYPYAASSIQDFWRRWHISLSTWFKVYLYIPLGGNRKGRPRTVLNKLIVFGLCGLWHGASWTFVAWGLFHGLFLLLEEYVPIRRLPRPLGWVYVLLVVTVGFVLFRSGSFEQAIFMITQMFGGWHFEHMAVARATWLLDPLVLATFALAIVAATPVLGFLRNLLAKWRTRAQAGDTREGDASKTAAALTAIPRILSYPAALTLIALCLLTLSGGGYNPFIYFRF
jgi:alginate O-acetyltransferase complex protein AlgI